jgi:homoserine O-succinyltransferase/O-acetyltransferase
MAPDKARLAILDMYDGTPNQGMRAIRELLRRFEHEIEYKIFDVRRRAEVPGLDFDLYLSTGGPGNPNEGDGHWDKLYYEWMQSVWEWNLLPGRAKKHVFFICHSFQMAIKHFGLAQVTRRKSKSFGTFPCHKTKEGMMDIALDGLPPVFYIADFRDWQCVQPDRARLEEIGAKILALEKERPHVPLERAIMAVRFSDEFVGTQFHPEADPEGMLDHFMDPERRALIAEEHGEEKYLNMIEHLNDSDKIALTYEIVLPLFFFRAIRAVRNATAMA